MELKRIGVMSAAKVGAVVGLIVGIIMAVIILAVGGAVASLAGPLGGTIFAGFSGLMAIGYIVFGLVGGFIGWGLGAFFYNIAAKYVGGVQLDLK